MGKLITFLTILIMIDLLFIVTGQVCREGDCSLGSVIFNSMINLVNLDGEAFFKELISGTKDFTTSRTGFAALLVAAAVTIGAVFFTRTDTALFIPIAMTFALLATDFVFIYSTLALSNTVLATLLIAPIAVIYLVAVLDWLRGKD